MQGRTIWAMEDCAVEQTNILYCWAHEACQLPLIPAFRVDLHDFNQNYFPVGVRAHGWLCQWLGYQVPLLFPLLGLCLAWVIIILYSWLCYLCYCLILSYNFFNFLIIRFGDKSLLSIFGVLEKTTLLSINVIILSNEVFICSFRKTKY